MGIQPGDSFPTRSADAPLADARGVTSRPAPVRRSGGPLGDRRGLTAAGCAVLLSAFGFIGALLDLMVGHDLWVMFGVGFIGAAAICALRCHAEDLGATIVLPPLIYFVIAVIFTLISPRSGTHTGGVRQFAIDLGGELVFSAPILLAATLVALGLATARGRASARKRQRQYQQRNGSRAQTR